MPAIYPARLKKQIADLVDYFDQPTVFVRELHHLLNQYADRVHRYGQSGEPVPLLNAYKVRSPILRHISQELGQRAVIYPEDALSLSDALWEEAYLEFKQLAVSLLGKIPLNPPDHILERIRRWVQDESDTQIIDYVFVYGLSSVWAQDKEFVMDMIEGWLIDTDVYAKRLGIRALIPIVEDYSYENIPNVYRLIHRLTLTAPSDLNTDLIELITALAKRSPQETAYFLSQNLSHPESSHTARLIRKCKSEFPEDMQDYLLAAVRGIH